MTMWQLFKTRSIKTGKKNFEEGKITKEQLTAVEDDCIRDLVGKIKSWDIM